MYWSQDKPVRVGWEIEKKGPDTLPSSFVNRGELQLIAESKVDEAKELDKKDIEQSR